MQRFNTRENAGMIRFVVHSQIMAWTMDPSIVHGDLESNCRTCLATGDVLPAFCSLAAAYAIAFDCGAQTLEEMEALGETYSLEIKQGGNRVIAGIHDSTWQIVLNLRCDASDILRLDNSLALSMAPDVALSYGNDVLEFAFLSRDVQQSYLLGDYKKADVARRKSETPMRSMTSSPHLILHYSYCALNCLMMCCSTGGGEPVRKNSYFKLAIQYLAKLHHWQKDYGSCFGGHLIKLIQAEFARVEGRSSLAEKYYQASVWVAGRQGNLRDRGLAHELAGRFFLWGGRRADNHHNNRTTNTTTGTRRDETWAAYHFDQAIQAYHAWGAKLLVNRLLDKFGEVVSRDSSRSEVSSQLLARQTHDMSIL